MKLIFNKIVLAPHLFVTDVMLSKFSNNLNLHKLSSFAMISSDSCNRQQLVELLRQMPIRQTLRYHQLMLPRDVDSEFVAVVKTTDFMPLLLYRCKLYERCAQLCQRAVYEMIDGQVRPITRLCFLYSEFVQLMDDDIVSVIGMTVLVDKSGTQSKSKLRKPLSISQLAMSLYLLTQCQINIQNSNWKSDISPLADILGLIGEAEKLMPYDNDLDKSILKLAERFSLGYITDRLNSSPRETLSNVRLDF